MGLLGKSRTCIGCGKTFRGLMPWRKYDVTGKEEDKNECFCNECRGILPIDLQAPLEKVPWRIIEAYFADCQRRRNEHSDFQVTYKLGSFLMDEDRGLFQLGDHGKIYHVSELDGYKFIYESKGKGDLGNLVFRYRIDGERYYDENAKKGDILRFDAGILSSREDVEEKESPSMFSNVVTVIHYYSEPFSVQKLRWRFDAMCAYSGVPIDENGSGVEQIIWECMDYYLCNDGKMVRPKTVDTVCKWVRRDFGSKKTPRYEAEIEMVYQSVRNIAAVQGEYERRFRRN